MTPTLTHLHPQHTSSGPRQPAQQAGNGGRGSTCTQTLPTTAEGSPPGDAPPPPPQYATAARKDTTLGTGAGTATSPAARSPHRARWPRGQCWAATPAHPRPQHVGRGLRQPPGGEQPEEGEHLASDAPHNRATRATRAAGGAPSAYTNTRTPARGASVRAPPPTPHRAHNACTSHGKSAPHPLLLDASNKTMAEPAAPRKTRPQSPTLDAAHQVSRALGLRGDEGDLLQEDAGADSDLEIVPEPPAGNTPAEPMPPAGSVPALCPAWKRGHCTGEDLCPKRHPRPGPDDGALPEVGHAAARAALHYGVAQGWILDETARGSVNIQEAVDRVAHTGQAEVALHTQSRRGRPAEGIVVEPSGMVLVLAADMVRGVLHASRVRRARPQ